MKKCPFCVEEIQDEAIKCRHCGSMLTDAPTTSPQGATVPATGRARRYRTITESDARLLNVGSTVELEADGTVSARVEDLLAEKRVTVVRLSSPRAVPQSVSRTVSSSGAQPERTIYETGVHWVVFGRPVAWLVLALFLWKINDGMFAAIFVGNLVLVAMVDVGFRLLMRSHTNFKLTTRRLSMSTGVLRKRSVELILSKVESISVDEPMFGRIFGYGTLIVGGTGGLREAFKLVRGPQQFRTHVQEQLAVQAA